MKKRRTSTDPFTDQIMRIKQTRRISVQVWRRSEKVNCTSEDQYPTIPQNASASYKKAKMEKAAEKTHAELIATANPNKLNTMSATP